MKIVMRNGTEKINIFAKVHIIYMFTIYALTYIFNGNKVLVCNLK